MPLAAVTYIFSCRPGKSGKRHTNRASHYPVQLIILEKFNHSENEWRGTAVILELLKVPCNLGILLSGGERATQMKEVKHISFYYLTDERFTAL